MKSKTIVNFESAAKQKLAPEIFGYFSSGAEEELTLKQNIAHFSQIDIIHKQSSNTPPKLETNILGQNMKLPFGFAPSAMHKLACKQGQQVTAKVAFDEGLCLGISTLSTVSLAKISEVNKNSLRMLQLYILKDKHITQHMVKMAQKYGFKGLIITVDAQVMGKRKTDSGQKLFDPKNIKFQVIQQIQNNLSSLKGVKIQRKYILENRDVSLNWQTIAWLRSITKLHIILKGIMCVQDAIIAAKLDIDAVYVSNHGARQLDGVSSTFEVLPFICQAVRTFSKKTQVYVDGGVRSGYDIFKCIAMGANYVFLGRPVIYSLVQEQGLKNMVEILKEQLREAMMKAGTKTVQQINLSHIKYSQPSAKL